MEMDKFNKMYNELSKKAVVNENTDVEIEKTDIKPEANPKDLKLDSTIIVSQEIGDGTVKSYEFSICEVWLKPNNMWTIINAKKVKEEKNFWILFYDNGTYYLKKGIKGPIGVHISLSNDKE